MLNKKKLSIVSIFAVIFLLISTITSMAAPVPMPVNNMKIFVNNKEVSFNKDMGYPLSENDRTLVPIRVISENMGYKVVWNPTLKQVTVQNKDRMVILNINSTVATVNGKQVNMDTKAQIIGNRTYVPLRFVAENMGATVEYKNIGGTQYVYITLQGGPEPDLPKDPTDVGTIPGTAGESHEANMDAIRDFFGEDLHSKGTVAFNPFGGALDNSLIWLSGGAVNGENYEVAIYVENWFTSGDEILPTANELRSISPMVKEILKFYLPNEYKEVHSIFDDGMSFRWPDNHNYVGTDISSGADGRTVKIMDDGGARIEIGYKK